MICRPPTIKFAAVALGYHPAKPNSRLSKIHWRKPVDHTQTNQRLTDAGFVTENSLHQLTGLKRAAYGGTVSICRPPTIKFAAVALGYHPAKPNSRLSKIHWRKPDLHTDKPAPHGRRVRH